MRILGIDTSTRFMCIGVHDRGRTYAYRLDVGRKLSALLAPAVKQVLNAAGVKPAQIDCFACGIGPGSFTGLRVGVAFVKGLSLVLRKPVVGVSTLDILSRNADALQGPLVTVLDAKRGLFYAAFYDKKRGVFKKEGPDMLLTAGELFRKARRASILLGDGIPLLGRAIPLKIKDAVVLDRDFWYPNPVYLISLAQDKINAGKRNLSNAFKIKPEYLYPKECQIKNAAP